MLANAIGIRLVAFRPTTTPRCTLPDPCHTCRRGLVGSPLPPHLHRDLRYHAAVAEAEFVMDAQRVAAVVQAFVMQI